MEPVIRAVRDGIDAVVAVGRSDRYDKDEPNGLIYIADSLEQDVSQLKGLWRELCAMTDVACRPPPLQAVEGGEAQP